MLSGWRSTPAATRESPDKILIPQEEKENKQRLNKKEPERNL